MRERLEKFALSLRASSATAPRLPDADRGGFAAGQTRDLPVPVQRASTHARVSDHAGSSEHSLSALDHVAFRYLYSVGTRDIPIAAQWLACAIPYRRFAAGLAANDARLGADADR